jgi:hypothetical protein
MASVGRCFKHHEEHQAKRRERWGLVSALLWSALGLAVFVAGSTGYIAKLLWELRGLVWR